MSEEKGSMTVQEAGRKGGKRNLEKYGREWFRRIGSKGGARMSELIEAGKRALAEQEAE